MCFESDLNFVRKTQNGGKRTMTFTPEENNQHPHSSSLIVSRTESICRTKLVGRAATAHWVYLCYLL